MTVQSKILIADDDASIRLVLSQAFTRLGYQVRATGNATTLLKWVSDGEGDLVITDVVMPDENVFDVLPRIKKQRPKLPVIVMSAQNTLMTAVNAAEIGAFDYVPKPFDLDDMTAAAKRALSRPVDGEAAKAQARAMRDERLPLIGRSAPMQDVYRTVARLVGADLTVLILGESGTGKELVARALHDLGRRRDGRFVVINLAAVPRERVETELFGKNDNDVGKLVEADGGTLFLDEIGDMPLDAQTRLLRVIDGSETTISPKTGRRPNVRIIAATNRDLRGLIGQGLFREDLFFRLNVAPVRLPPLRDRTEDIPDLARAFLLRAHREGLPAKTIDSGALERLKAGGWRIAMATGKSRRGVETVIRTHRWAAMFESTQCSDDGPGKPHPAMLIEAMRAAGARPDQTVMIGDTTHDLLMASRYSTWSARGAVSSSRPVMPFMAFMGVRISWLILARNCCLNFSLRSARFFCTSISFLALRV